MKKNLYKKLDHIMMRLLLKEKHSSGNRMFFFDLEYFFKLENRKVFCYISVNITRVNNFNLLGNNSSGVII